MVVGGNVIVVVFISGVSCFQIRLSYTCYLKKGVSSSYVFQ